MAQSSRSIPTTYPAPLAIQILKADAQRQASILRQEIVTDLISVLSDSREPQVRARILKLIEGHLKSGLMAARRAEGTWPDQARAKEVIEKGAPEKPALIRKHLKVLAQLDRGQRRSLDLLEDSFGHIRLILDRLQPRDDGKPNPASRAGPATSGTAR